MIKKIGSSTNLAKTVQWYWLIRISLGGVLSVARLMKERTLLILKMPNELGKFVLKDVHHMGLWATVSKMNLCYDPTP